MSPAGQKGPDHSDTSICLYHQGLGGHLSLPTPVQGHSRIEEVALDLSTDFHPLAPPPPLPAPVLTPSSELWRTPFPMSALFSVTVLYPPLSIRAPGYQETFGFRLCLSLPSSSWLDRIHQGGSACPSQAEDWLGVIANPQDVHSSSISHFGRTW